MIVWSFFLSSFEHDKTILDYVVALIFLSLISPIDNYNVHATLA